MTGPSDFIFVQAVLFGILFTHLCLSKLDLKRKNTLLAERHRERQARLLHQTFDAKKDLREIAKMPRSERMKAIAAHKEKSAFQRIGLAKIQAEIIQLLKASPDMPIGKLLENFRSRALGLGLSDRHFRTAKKILKRYRERRAAIKRLRQKHANDAQLYRELFSGNPKGKIKIVDASFCLYCKCAEVSDFARIRTGDENKLEAVEDIGGVYSSQTAIAGTRQLMAAQKRWQSPGYIYTHEIQHAINALIGKKQPNLCFNREMTCKTPDELKDYFTCYLRSRRRIAEASVHDELIAHFVDRSDSNASIFDTLTKAADKNGLYDYLAKERQYQLSDVGSGCPEILKPTAKEIIEHVYVKEYHELIRNGLDALWQLLDIGLTREESAALLIHEPLRRWKKIVDRITQALN